MALYICEHCASRNTSQGRCVVCKRSLGSLSTAVVSASIAAVALGAVWVTLSVITRAQLSCIAILYGGLVSGVMTHYSGGRGLVYQAIASATTILGMLLADTLVLWLLWDELQWPNRIRERPPFWEFFSYQIRYDMITAVFCLFGVIGGLWVWSEADGG